MFLLRGPAILLPKTHKLIGDEFIRRGRQDLVDENVDTVTEEIQRWKNDRSERPLVSVECQSAENLYSSLGIW